MQRERIGRHAVKLRTGHRVSVHAGDDFSGGFVVQNDRIAVVVGFTGAAEALPNGVAGLGKSGRNLTCCLVKHSERCIHPLDILRCTHGAVGIRRSSLDRKSIIAIAHAGKSETVCRADQRSIYVLETKTTILYRNSFFSVSEVIITVGTMGALFPSK